jgi:hypothetical protein
MATIEVGGSPISLPRRSMSNWDVAVKQHDDAFGPHIVLQHGTDVLYIMPTDEEAQALLEFCKKVVS